MPKATPTNPIGTKHNPGDVSTLTNEGISPKPGTFGAPSQQPQKAKSTGAAKLLGIGTGDIVDLNSLSPDNWGNEAKRRKKMGEEGKERDVLGAGNYASEEPGYYGISPIKAPLWKWEIAIYFFLGGLSAGAYCLARIGEALGGKKGKYRKLTQAGTYIATAAALPCAPLLIHDLGDPKRFHHMLRVVKLSSPMNFGSWALTGYTALSVLASLREFVKSRHDKGGKGEVAESPAARALDTSVMATTDIAGIPFALALAGYTGVLLSTSANPLWGRNPWVGALFSASAVHAGSSSIRLALELENDKKNAAAIEALEKIDTVAAVAEAVCSAGYLHAAGEMSKPIVTGKYGWQFLGGAIGLGLLAPSILDHLPIPKKAKRPVSILACILSLTGGFLLRWAFVHAGHDAALDAGLARKSGKKISSL